MSNRNFRLPKSTRPRRYELRIEADLDEWRFRGSSEIEVALAQATDEITLHAVGLEVNAVRAVLPDGSEVPGRPSFDREAETVSLRFERQLPAPAVRLHMQFGGEILSRLRGFYRSQKDGARYAATQFEAADARRAFPCFDEPEFKARFALTLVVPSGLTAISNGPVESETELGGGRKEVRFGETPPISSYLVAYTVGPYEATPVAATESGVPVRVFLPRGMADKGVYARDAHVRSLQYLEEYTGIPYPYGKVDAIGVPDFEAGAMENPGAITYRLTAIAADPERASTPALKGIFYTAAHELTHMWWGDLVTMAWWDDLWLNESFATFVGYKATADLVPEWKLWRDFVATLARPFNLDALDSTHPVSFEVQNAKQATERFDVITYWKGAAVVRMLEAFLGTEPFRAGVRAYLERHREANATAEDFWRELDRASGRDVSTIASAWIRQAGHPIVVAEAEPLGNDRKLSLRQERFYADAQLGAAKCEVSWPIPLVIKYGTETGVHSEKVLLESRDSSFVLRGARWFYPNGDGAGFYRFQLDNRSLAALVAVLPEALRPEERLDLVGNQWALVRAGKAAISQFLSVVEGLAGETDRAVLSAMTERIAWSSTNLVEDAARPAFERFVARLFAPALARLGWEPGAGESADDRLRRATVISALGEIAALPEVEIEAARRLDGYLRDRETLDPNLASVVVSLAARRGDAALYERYLAVKRAATADPEEEQRFLFGLTAFEDPALVRRSLDLSLTDEVRPQDRAHLLARLLGQRASRLAAWAFVREHWTEITSGMDPMLEQNVVRALAQVTPEPAAAEICRFLPAHAKDETRETVAQAVEQLRIDAAACVRLAADLTAWLAAH